MGALDFIDIAGSSSKEDKYSNGFSRMDIDDDNDDYMDFVSSDSDEEFCDLLEDLNESDLRKECRKASTAFFDQYGLISHQINSYNDFIKYGVQKVFDSIGEVKIEPGYDPSKNGDEEWKRARLKFGKVTLDRPTFWRSDKDDLEMHPRHARIQNITYSSRIGVEVHLEVYTTSRSGSDKFKTGDEEILENKSMNEYHSTVHYGKLPVMVKSDLCWMNGIEKRDCEFDEGGYFVIKGAEKTFIAQETICLKRLWVAKKDPALIISYRPVSTRERVHVKLVPRVSGIVGGELTLTVYFSMFELPIWILFFALGIPNDREVVKLLDADTTDGHITNLLLESIYDADMKCDDFRKGDNATKYITELMQTCKFPPAESIEECIRCNLFPSLKTHGQKARFLAYMVKSLLDAYRGRRKIDNRDDFRNKRLELAGDLLERELRAHIKHAHRRLIKALQRDLYQDREVQSLHYYLDPSIITNGLSRAFSTGAWCHSYKRMERISGVVATLRRTNPLQTLIDMRKSRQQVQYTGRVGDARYPHPSHWGKLCFLSTPDGENCGLVKNLASMGLVSTSFVEHKDLIRRFHQCGMEKLVDDYSSSLKGKQNVFLDGEWIGTCADSASFVSKLRRKRRKMEIFYQVEIKRDEHHGEVRIFADAGRILRPLLVVRNLKNFKNLNKGEYSFQSLLKKGIVEFIGAEEEEDIKTAWDIRHLFSAEKERPPVKYTHCELDMSLLLGLSCGIIPFANHNHAKRVLYQSEKHCQQAIGFTTTNPNIRVDTNTHQLYYPQRPLFRTMLADSLGKSRYSDCHKGMIPHPEFFNGQCAIVAVNVHLGYNQEDSLVMNRASLERGMFRSEHMRSYKADVENSEGPGRNLKPDEIINFGKMESKFGRVDCLDDDGFPYIGANLQTGDIIIGKHAASGVDHSVKLKLTERGIVQKVVLSADDDGKNFAVVSLRQVRTPCLGDKFSSMHGQKGVLGYCDSQENFPFTIDGIVPDIIINPHAFPSRQTPGQLLEAALGKGIALGGELKYATPFSTPSIDDITAQLHRLGFSRGGAERVYDGRTGEKVESLIFMGPTFYQRLTHMAIDKVKYRNTGPVHPFTRQPVADKKRFGGIKFGEMERDCLIAHGASVNLHERLFALSDSSQMHICSKCKTVANVVQRVVPGGRKIRGPHCRMCESVEHVVKVDVPYGAKLLTQELFSMGISLKFDTQLR